MLFSILWRVYVLLWISKIWSEEAEDGQGQSQGQMHMQMPAVSEQETETETEAETETEEPETTTRSAKHLLKEHRVVDILPTIPSIGSFKDKPFSYKPFFLNKFQSKYPKNKTDPYTRVTTHTLPKTQAQENSVNSKKSNTQQSQSQSQSSSNQKSPQPTQKPTQQPPATGTATATAATTTGGSASSPDTPRPACAREMNFCLHTVDYPEDRVHDTIDSYYDDVRLIYNELHQYTPEEFITDDNVTHKFRHKGHFVCESEVAYIRIGWALNWKNRWMIVLNTDKYPQSVRIETCKYPNGRCEYLPPCYKSMCIQRQMPVKLLAIDPNKPHHRPIVDVFQIPTSCSCFVENFTYNGNNN